MDLRWGQEEGLHISAELRNSTATQIELASSSSNQRHCNSPFVCGDSTTRILGVDLWSLDRLHGVKWNPIPTLSLRRGLRTEHLISTVIKTPYRLQKCHYASDKALCQNSTVQQRVIGVLIKNISSSLINTTLITYTCVSRLGMGIWRNFLDWSWGQINNQLSI